MGRATKAIPDSTSRSLGYQTRGRTRQARKASRQASRSLQEEEEVCDWSDSQLKEEVEEEEMEMDEWQPSQAAGKGSRKRTSVACRYVHGVTDEDEDVPAEEMAFMSQTLNQTPGEDKQLMRPWLIRQVELGRIPGLQWLDNRKTLLRIPWMHGSSQKWKVNHSELFKSWAKHSGMSPDPPKLFSLYCFIEIF